ncbi:nodulation protein NoeA [soil metagenome]
MASYQRIPSSFRDSSGFMVFKDDVIMRHVQPSYKDNYDILLSSGLYKELTQAELLVRHEEVTLDCESAYKVLLPQKIEFISYPYEWCFSQLKAAALATLQVQKLAMKYGMTLKDSSAYNIQFQKGLPLLIDTLSFVKYNEGAPWNAYRQFCQHFLAPLTLMSYRDLRLNRMLQTYIDGIPLDLACSLLPKRTWANFGLLTHLHLHSMALQHYSDSKAQRERAAVNKTSTLGLIEHLISTVESLKFPVQSSTWSNYYEDNNYTAKAITQKQEVVTEFLKSVSPNVVWDLGCNTGVFSRLVSRLGIRTIAMDADPVCTEHNYKQALKDHSQELFPLVIDLSVPSPYIGWANEERMSLASRGPADTVLALALVHHLSVANNVPFSHIAKFMDSICQSLIIEFVPRTDSQTQRLMASRDSRFSGYTQENFELEFKQYFSIEERVQLVESERSVYLMKKLASAY